ncbi:hypothetical protein ASPFODRAFT_362305 [Aspergillus luchuensis CBS 106.47]|uniref:Uncharacterized protein n=1 Tax=Aspergillus luchuensis (strain CBS 106.47) TaxID=1137211 RepID=A0A1M3T4Z0_ASPLC|nr:hypothetical protein ASPFODRAFT_362305 [Aspergillus luchuensis CBS 106.47]
MDSSIETNMTGYMRVTKQVFGACSYTRAFQLIIDLQYSETQFLCIVLRISLLFCIHLSQRCSQRSAARIHQVPSHRHGSEHRGTAQREGWDNQISCECKRNHKGESTPRKNAKLPMPSLQTTELCNEDITSRNRVAMQVVRGQQKSTGGA